MNKERIIEIISEQLDIEQDKIKEETAFTDLGADSFDLFQVISALEEEFDVTFDIDNMDQFKTIKDAISYVEKAIAK